MRLLAIVPARGGSKGIPGKNLRRLAGKPLIAHTILEARRVQRITRLVASTDSPEIAEAARDAGVEVPWLRPPELATDTAPSSAVVRHAVLAVESEEGRPYDGVLVLQPTSPLRTAEDVDGALDLFEGRGAPAVFSVTELEHPLAWTLLLEADGRIVPHPVAASAIDYRLGRQAHAKVYRISGAVYVYRRAVALEDRPGLPVGTVAYPMPAERSIDIDREIDLVIAEALLAKRGPAR